jgi:hypothetical protein
MSNGASAATVRRDRPRHYPRGATLQPKISHAHLDVVQSLVDQQNDALLKELCERFAERTGIAVSVPTMHRALRNTTGTTDAPRVSPLARTGRCAEFGIC